MLNNKILSFDDFKIGDILEVNFLIVLTEKKTQKFKGILISKKQKSKSFTIRKTFSNEGIEFTFKFDSPKIVDIIVISRNNFKKAKLYFLKDKKYKNKKLLNKF